MRVDIQPTLPEPTAPLAAPTTWTWSLATWVSRLAGPPSLAIVTVLTAASVAPDTGKAWRWAIAYLATAVVVPMLYVGVRFVRGTVADLDLRHREERVGPYTVAVGAVLIATTMMHIGGAPLLLVRLGEASVIELACLAVITLYWKVSAHAAMAATLAAFTLVAAAPAAAPCVALASLVCWSRVHLGHHDVAQTIAGAAVGAGAVLFGVGWP